MKKIFNILCVGLVCCSATTLFTSCDDFLDEHKPQATLSDEQVKSPENAEAMAISAYAIFTSAEDINSSFSMWNFDVRSDDAYKGGNGTSDGDVFHQLEVQQGVLTTNWNINDMWVRLYNSLSRVNSAIALLKETDDSYTMKGQRLAEMKFLRAYGHFLLKRLYKNIPFVVNENLTYDEYNELSNTQYTNDEGWQLIIDDLMEAYNTLPEVQQEKGRPTRAAAAAFLAKVYLYKAYRQDDAKSNQVTSINQGDLEKVIEFTNPSLYANYGLEDDMHNNFRPEEEYENGIESIWAIQYSRNDGSTYGNLNWSYGLIPPNIPGATDGGCDFYKPSQNLVNAYRTGADGLPLLDNFNDKDYDLANDNADPRLFLTVGMPGLPYMFNRNYMMEETSIWSRTHRQLPHQGLLLGQLDEPHRLPLCRRAADACRGSCPDGPGRPGHQHREPVALACCHQHPDDFQLSQSLWREDVHQQLSRQLFQGRGREDCEDGTPSGNGYGERAFLRPRALG